MKVSTALGYMNIPDGVLMDLNHIKSLPKNKVCIITTGSQGETMSALSRMAFSTHRQVDIQPGDKVIVSASTIRATRTPWATSSTSSTARGQTWSTSGNSPSMCPATPARRS